MRIAVVATVVCLSVIGLSVAADVEAAMRMPTDIPAQALRPALQKLSKDRDFQLVFRTDLVGDLRTSGAAGDLTLDEALKQLLKGTDLTYAYLDEKTVTIVPIASTRSADSSGSGPVSPSVQPTSAPEDPKVSSDRFRVAQVDQGTPSGPSSVEKQKDQASKQKPEQLEEVVVTGSHIHGISETASPMRTIDRVQIDATGVTTTEDLMRTLPENVGGYGVDTSMAATPGAGQHNGFNATGVNLRGLGTDATLVLLNGHRLPLASNGFSVDIATIPLAAIDHVDILKDSASSVYGSDAVTGVVNFVTVSKFQGAQSELSGGSVTDGHKRDMNVSQLLGTSWESGSIFGSYTYNYQGSLDTADRTATATALQPSEAIPRTTSNAIYLSANQQFGSRVNAQVDVLGSDRKFRAQSAFTTSDPITGNDVIDLQFSDIHNNSLILDGSVIVALPADWRTSAVAQYAASRSVGDNHDSLGSFPAPSAERGRQYSMDLSADGPVFDLPGGAIKFALGVSDRRESYGASAPIAPGGLPQDLFDMSRNIGAAFGEFFVPIVGTTNETNLIHRLELTASDRFDHYSDFGSTNNPKFGLLFAPTKDITFRTTYSTAFRAPLLSELERDSNNSVDLLINFPDAGSPTGNSNQIYRIGGNPNLRPETARSITGGLDFQPEIVPGLSASLNYFSIDFKHRIEAPTAALITLQPDIYAPYITRNPSAALVEAITSGPLFFSTIVPFTPADVQVIADQRIQNLNSVKINGLDLDVNWTRRAGFGSLIFGMSASYLLKFDQTLVAGLDPIPVLNTPYFPTRLRLRGVAGWTNAGWSSNLAVNYANSYTDNTDPTQLRPVGSWMTVDGQVAVKLPAFNLLFNNARLSLSVQNIFDRRPPFLLNQASSNVTSFGFNYDPVNASVLGRFVSLGLTSRW